MSNGLLLHVGCGGEALPQELTGFKEIRLDIDEKHRPDIVANITDLGEVGKFNVVYSAHVLEHLYPHDLKLALKEFLRVLDDGCVCVAIVPDLEDIRPTDEVVYISPAGPVTGLDMYYGMRSMLKENPYMAHRNGFVKSTLEKELIEAGFSKVDVKRVHSNLLGIAYK